MALMNKRIIINLPEKLYKRLKTAAGIEYKSVSGFVRESVLEKIQEDFTPEELDLIEKGRTSFRAGKGVDWRKVKRG